MIAAIIFVIQSSRTFANNYTQNLLLRKCLHNNGNSPKVYTFQITTHRLHVGVAGAVICTKQTPYVIMYVEGLHLPENN